jgi:hypothetical protein
MQCIEMLRICAIFVETQNKGTEMGKGNKHSNVFMIYLCLEFKNKSIIVSML